MEHTLTQHTITVDGHVFPYAEAGSGDEIFVFIHGVTASIAAWYEYVDAFAARGRVILLPLPGHYPADFPPGYSAGEITASAWGELGGKVIGQITGGAPVTVIGHSTGGFQALAIAAFAPQIVKRTVSISGFAYGAWAGLLGVHQKVLLSPLGPLYGLWFRLTYRLAGLSADTLYASLRIYNPDGRAPLDRDGTMAMTRDNLSFFRLLNLGNMITVFKAMRDHVDMRDQLGQITAPVMVVGADRDPIVPPAHVDAILAGVPGAEQLIVPGGHMAVAEEAPTIIAAIFAWLDA
jgi:pimeloyl-ACP methyl ester carboxylesterase